MNRRRRHMFRLRIGRLVGRLVRCRAQAPTRMPLVGWLGVGATPTGSTPVVTDFQQGLRDAGFVEGKNVGVHYRYANSQAERLPILASELVQLKVDVIVTSGEQATAAAMNATTGIPIVATEFGVDPVRAGFISSLRRPEGNLTGLVMLADALWPKRFELLKQIAPRLSRLAVLWSAAFPSRGSCPSRSAVTGRSTATSGSARRLRWQTS